MLKQPGLIFKVLHISPSRIGLIRGIIICWKIKFQTKNVKKVKGPINVPIFLDKPRAYTTKYIIFPISGQTPGPYHKISGLCLYMPP